MDRGDGKIRWAPKAPQQKIRRLYQTDAKGIIDDELINDVGVSYSRDSWRRRFLSTSWSKYFIGSDEDAE